MNLATILPLVVEISAKVKQDLKEGKMTIRELLKEIELVVDELGLGDIVIIDLGKREEE